MAEHRCACISIGSELFAAEWSPSEPRPGPVAVPVGDNGATALSAYVELTDGADIVSLRRWLERNLSSSQHAELPVGILLGNRTARPQPGSAIQSVCRLLGVRGLDGEETLRAESRACGVDVEPEGGEDWQESGDQEAPRDVQAQLRVPKPKGKGERVDLAAHQLVSLLLARCAMRFSEKSSGIAGGLNLTAVAVAVPSWWSAGRRQALEKAACLAGLKVSRIAIRPACAAIGLFSRMEAEEEPTDVQRSEKSRIEEVGDDGDVPRCLILVADADEDSGDSVLFEARPGDMADKALWERASRENPPSARWLAAAQQVVWRVVASVGEPLRSSENISLEIEAMTGRLLGEADIIGSELAGVVLCGAAVGTTVCGVASGARVFEAAPGDVAAGLAQVVAAEAGVSGSSGTVIDRLSFPVGIIKLPQSNATDIESFEESILYRNPEEEYDPGRAPMEVLFAKNVVLPAVTKRRYHAETYHDDMFLAFFQPDTDETWRRFKSFPSLLTVEEPQEDDGAVSSAKTKYRRCESVQVKYKLDSSGRFSATVVDYKGEMKPDKSIFRIAILVVIICVLIATLFSNAAERRRLPVIRTPFHEQIESFVKQHSPEDVREVDRWVKTYRGRERGLVTNLENRYGGKFQGFEEL